MGPGPPWSPGAPPKSVQCTVRAPPCPPPAGVAAGGLAWVRTSGGVGLCDLRPGASMPGRVMLRVHAVCVCVCAITAGGVRQLIILDERKQGAGGCGHEESNPITINCGKIVGHCRKIVMNRRSNCEKCDKWR